MRILFIFAILLLMPIALLARNRATSRYMSDFSRELIRTQPPWSKPIYSGTQVTVPGLENVPDIHGDINNPQLVVFFAGNQYMLVNQLLRDFQLRYPEYRRVVAFTFPPGRLIKAFASGHGLLLGNMHVSLTPDVLTAGKRGIQNAQKAHHWFLITEAYARNRLAIMVQKGNPKHILGLTQLADKNLRLCMPDPHWEGIARHAIIPALRKAGGQNLVHQVYSVKVREGTTFLTHIHHRQTPIRIMQKKCDAGVVWYSEAYFHAHILHHNVSIVRIKREQNKTVVYVAGQIKTSRHLKAAREFMRFLLSRQAQALYRYYGFLPPKKTPKDE